jgi:4'-phosphopantetheinyl transferase EntD
MPLGQVEKLNESLDCFLKNVRFVSMSELDKVSGLDKSSVLDKVVIYQSNFDKAHYQRAFFDKLSVRFPLFMEKSVIKRQAEYLAGRYIANRALNSLGVYSAEVSVGNNRCPVWPEGIIASITHTDGTALCAAAHRNDIRFLGVDLEDWISSETTKEIKSSVVCRNEEAFLRQSPLTFEQAFTLAFSAKESLFKALYMDVGYYFDFDAARITDISKDERKFRIELNIDLTPELTKGRCFTGYYHTDSQRILTMVVEKVQISLANTD